MLKSPWIRKPDFTRIRHLDYETFWARNGALALRSTLKPRECIMSEMVPIGSIVLDMGCGISCLPERLREEKGVNVTVADISRAVVALHQKRGVRGIVIDVEDIEALKKLGKYDYIILSEVLEHTRFPEEIIEELKRHTSYFLISVPNSAAYVFRYGLAVRGRFFTQWVQHPSEHLRFWSHLDFLNWLDALGVTVERVEVADGFTCRGLLPFLPRVWKNLFGYRMVYVGRPRATKGPNIP